MRGKATRSMQRLEAPVGMRKNLAPRSECFLFVTVLVSGIPKTNVLNSGISITDGFMEHRQSESFRFPIGRNWTCGNTSSGKAYRWYPFTLQRKGKSWCAEVC